jgi:hypothetical protein
MASEWIWYALLAIAIVIPIAAFIRWLWKRREHTQIDVALKFEKEAESAAAAIERSNPFPPEARAQRLERRHRVQYSVSADQFSLGDYIKRGKGVLAENIPRVMRTKIAVNAEVRISKQDLPYLTEGMEGEIQKHQIQATKAMTVTLQSPDGAFAIQSLSRETQFIDSSHLQQLGLIGQLGFGSWKWIVTPIKRGKHVLNIVIAARTRDEEGLEAETVLPGQIIPVEVRVNYYESAKQFASWLLVGAAGGLVSAYAPELVKLIRP